MNKLIFKNIYILTVALIWVFIGCAEDTIEEEFFGSLRGSVVTETDGEALEGVTITTSPSTTTVFTDAQGNFSIPNIPVDNYSVNAELNNFESAFEGVEIFDNQESVVAFELALVDQSLAAPAAPVLLLPEDGADDLESEVTFEWEAAVSDAPSVIYSLEVRNSFTNEIRIFEVEDETTITVSDLDLGATYFWQVAVSDGENPAVLSLISEFSTLAFPSNAFLFVKKEGSNNVIFSGGGANDNDGSSIDENLFQLTNPATNSFRPRRNSVAQKIAFLRSVGGETHLFAMDLTGENVVQITSNIPVAGFRQEEIDFTWGPNGDYLLFPSFNVLYRINVNGTGITPIYTTPDGSFISEVSIPEFDEDLVVLKTNNTLGYDVRIFTLRLSLGLEEIVILEEENGAAGGIEITANADEILFTRDISGSQNANYRLFESRIFVYDVESATASQLQTGVIDGENDLDASFSPSEGAIIFTRSLNTLNAVPQVFRFNENTANGNALDLLFTEASMPDWD